MSVSSPAGPDQPYAGRRSIRFTFIAMVAVPVMVLVIIWSLALGITLSSALSSHSSEAHHHQQLIELELLASAGLLVVIAAVLLMGWFARRLSHDITDLAAAARRLAEGQAAGGRSRGGRADAADLLPQGRTAEVAQAAAAIASLRRAAAASAASETSLRDGLRQVFVSLARRNQSLLQRQLRLIDALEQKASDPAALADLFSLDHLTTRMRRHAESLAILSGAAPGRAWRDPVPVIDVIRGAMAEVEDYKRVTVLTRSEDAITGSAVADMIHLLAELIENATLFSPSGTRVEVRAGRVANGFAVEVDDRGLGIEPAQLSEINQQLASPPDFDLANSDRLGLFVGGKLAARHGVRVSLRTSPYGGTTAIVLMPNSIVVPADMLADQAPGTPQATPRSAGLDLRGAGSPPMVTDGRETAALAAGSRAAEALTSGVRAAGSRAAQAWAMDVPTAGARADSSRGPDLRSGNGSAADAGTPGAGAGDADAGNAGAGASGTAGPRVLEPRALPTRTSTRRAAEPDAAAAAALLASPVPASPMTAGTMPASTAPASTAPASTAPASTAPASTVQARTASVSTVPASVAPVGPAPEASAAPSAPARAPQLGTSLSSGPLGGGPLGNGSLAAPPNTDTYHGLPRRTRQASLSPHLRDSAPAAARQPSSDELSALAQARGPEQARDLAASLQSGWLRGRGEDPAEQPGGTAAVQPAGQLTGQPAGQRPGQSAGQATEPVTDSPADGAQDSGPGARRGDE